MSEKKPESFMPIRWNFIWYLNGEYVAAKDAKVSCLDWCCHGYSVYDTSRTANRTKIFRLDEHIGRFYRSLRAAEIDPQLSPEEMKQIHMEVMNRNRDFLAENDDMWLLPRASPGVWGTRGHPTVMLAAIPLPFKKWAPCYKLGRHEIVPSIRTVPPQCIDPQIKHDSRLFMHLCENEVERIEPASGALMLDIYGNVAEETGSNFFIVKNGKVITPPENIVLGGISRKVVLELCEKLNIPAFERNFTLYNVYNADEAFESRTSGCIVPVSYVNGRRLWTEIPGPITKRLLDAFSEEIGLDIAEQYLSHLSKEERDELDRKVANIKQSQD